MCGIVGYVGKLNATDIIIKGLSALEYRGYDSSGISILKDGRIFTLKRPGRISNLKEALKENPIEGNVGIGHVRWATHGVPNEINAHPHNSMNNTISLVHNGIIENYLELKNSLLEEGYTFKSQTDTEVVSNLIEKFYKENLLDAVNKTLSLIRGSYAFGIICSKEKDRLIACKNSSPLVGGIFDDGIILASDITSLISYTDKIIYFQDGDVIDINGKDYKIYNNGKEVNREIKTVNMSMDAASKEGYPHFLLKEIHEQPKVLEEVLSVRLKDGKINLEQGDFSLDQLKNFNKIYAVACGTAYHACLGIKYFMEKILQVPVICEVASEFKYENYFIDKNSLMIVVSQSGETADTISAINKAKSVGATTLSITNVVGSTVSRLTDRVMYCYCGPEISVASTKAYTSQLLAGFLLGLDMAFKLEKISKDELDNYLNHLKEIPQKISQILKNEENYKLIANSIKNAKSMFYTGRGLDYVTAKEGALKLKEISYIHAEAFQTGELKHGPLALIEKDTPVISIATQKHTMEKTASNNEELLARGAKVFAVGFVGNKLLESCAAQFIEIPETLDLYAPLLAIIPLQVIAYYVSSLLGNDVDKPRNLAKSVTVE